MKIKIKFENSTISFTAKKDISVKELIKSLKNSPNLNLGNEEIKLIDEDQRILENEEIIKINPINKKSEQIRDFIVDITKNDMSYLEKNLYLITYKKMKNKESKYSSKDQFFSNKTKNQANDIFNISDLIMKTTNAKEQINMCQNLKTKNDLNAPYRIFDSMPDPLGSHTSQINQLLNFLRPMIEDDTLDLNIPFRPGRHNRFQQNPIIPDENYLNNLKEMGFPEEQCRRALISARNDISRATDLLLSDGLDYMPNEIPEPSSVNNQEEVPMDILDDGEEAIDIPQNILRVNINDLNNHNDLNINDDYNENIHSENVNINMNFIEPNLNPHQNNSDNQNN